MNSMFATRESNHKVCYVCAQQLGRDNRLRMCCVSVTLSNVNENDGNEMSPNNSSSSNGLRQSENDNKQLSTTPPFNIRHKRNRKLSQMAFFCPFHRVYKLLVIEICVHRFYYILTWKGISRATCEIIIGLRWPMAEGRRP